MIAGYNVTIADKEGKEKTRRIIAGVIAAVLVAAMIIPMVLQYLV